MARMQTSRPAALHDRAAANLDYIRAAMERTSSFTGVSGAGFVASGLSAVAAAALAARQPSMAGWIAVWAAELLLAAAISVLTSARKGRRVGTPLGSPPARRFLLAFAPPMLAGAVLSAALLASGVRALVPAVWLLLYGAAVANAGAHSVRAVQFMGLAFMGVGLVAAFFPSWGDPLLALGFGGLHVGFGVLLMRRHGG
jgi:hypothetical protein